MFGLIRSRSFYGSIISEKSGAGMKRLDYFTHPDMTDDPLETLLCNGKGTSGFPALKLCNDLGPQQNNNSYRL